MNNNLGTSISVWYTLDEANHGWKHDTGYITENMIKKQLPKPGKETLVLLCCPKPMIDGAAIPMLRKLGYKDSNITKF